MKIHILEDKNYSQEAIYTYLRVPTKTGHQLKISQGKNIPKDVEILVLGLDPFDKSKIDKYEDLKIIAFNTTGEDHVDVEYAKSKGIEIISLKGDPFMKEVSASSEHAFGLILSCMRKYKISFEYPTYQLDREKYTGSDLAGKTLGIIGFGRIGHKVYKMAHAFGMKCIVNDPECHFGLSLAEVLEQSDVILLSPTLNDTTMDMIGLEQFKLMKKTAYLVNISRGEVIQQGVLYEALNRKFIAGAGIDVHRSDDKQELLRYARTYDNLIVTNHISGNTAESKRKTEEHIAQKVVEFIERKTIVE